MVGNGRDPRPRLHEIFLSIDTAGDPCDVGGSHEPARRTTTVNRA
jgi:hypothetical protein